MKGHNLGLCRTCGKIHISHNKGLTLEKEHGEKKANEIRRKLSESHKGIPTWNKGKHLSEETKKKLSESLKGRKAWNKGLTEETDIRVKINADGMRKTQKGHHYSPKTEFKKYQRISPKTEFKKGNISLNIKPKTKIICENCGIAFLISPWELNKNRKFCSIKCHGEWLSKNIIGQNHPLWKGGISLHYGPNWNKQKKKALERDDYSCQKCGAKLNEKWLDVHHIIPFINFGKDNFLKANQLSNLVVYCRLCHKKEEKNIIEVRL